MCAVLLGSRRVQPRAKKARGVGVPLLLWELAGEW
eukprot:COSAG02_NODE_44989_length_361_cov_0.782443_2_plen_34_part_01